MDEVSSRRAPRFVLLTDDASLSAVGRYAWRLDAANHRQLARAVRLDPDVDACRASAARLRQRIGAAAAGVLYERAGGFWTWRLVQAGAVSIHPYLRRVECIRGFVQFVDAVALADPEDGVVRSFGAHTLQWWDASPAPVGQS